MEYLDDLMILHRKIFFFDFFNIILKPISNIFRIFQSNIFTKNQRSIPEI